MAVHNSHQIFEKQVEFLTLSQELIIFPKIFENFYLQSIIININNSFSNLLLEQKSPVL
jgi:hypothetical protein